MSAGHDGSDDKFGRYLFEKIEIIFWILVALILSQL
jgi:hypothetical protein